MVGATRTEGIPQRKRRVSAVTHDELLDSVDKKRILLPRVVTKIVTVAFCNTHEIRPDPPRQTARSKNSNIRILAPAPRTPHQAPQPLTSSPLYTRRMVGGSGSCVAAALCPPGHMERGWGSASRGIYYVFWLVAELKDFNIKLTILVNCYDAPALKAAASQEPRSVTHPTQKT